MTIGVVGASVRAAVASLQRAGFEAWAVDQFCDRDLSRQAASTRCPFEQYPAILSDLAATFPPGPVLYTGGLENEPAIVDRLAATRPLWGNSSGVLAKVRDPFWIHNTLFAHGLRVPRILPGRAPIPREGQWLRKSLHSSGGLGVRFADSTTMGGYLQEFIAGEPMSAVFTSTPTECNLFGITAQLIGEPWLHARGCQYCGNVGPIPVPPELEDRLSAIGKLLHSTAQLEGVWGIDFILWDGIPYVVEVNPRYTASVEVLEFATGRSVFGSIGPAAARVIGKGIIFAGEIIRFPPAGPWDDDLERPFDPWRLPQFADIPTPGDVIEAGRPVMTVFAAASTSDECRLKLRERATELDRIFTVERHP